jgi:hypothetical protein
MLLCRREACQNGIALQFRKRNTMSQNIRLVIPAAPPPAQASGDHLTHRRIGDKGIRLGVLDNSKGNADHLLAMIVDSVRAQVPIASVVLTRKPYVSMAAPPEILDQLAQEADVVISAMAD